MILKIVAGLSFGVLSTYSVMAQVNLPPPPSPSLSISIPDKVTINKLKVSNQKILYVGKKQPIELCSLDSNQECVFRHDDQLGDTLYRVTTEGIEEKYNPKTGNPASALYRYQD